MNDVDTRGFTAFGARGQQDHRLPNRKCCTCWFSPKTRGISGIERENGRSTDSPGRSGPPIPRAAHVSAYAGSMVRIHRSAALLTLALGLSLSAACAQSIQHVLADPSRYKDRDVTISGRVLDSYSVAGRGA